MLNAAIVRTVEFCTRHVWGVFILALILATVSGTYTVSHFSIDTNVNNLISRDLPWRKRELEYQAAFPQSRQLILDCRRGTYAGANQRGDPHARRGFVEKD